MPCEYARLLIGVMFTAWRALRWADVDEGLVLLVERREQHHLRQAGALHGLESFDDLAAAADEAGRLDPFRGDELPLVGFEPHAVADVGASVTPILGDRLHERGVLVPVVGEVRRRGGAVVADLVVGVVEPADHDCSDGVHHPFRPQVLAGAQHAGSGERAGGELVRAQRPTHLLGRRASPAQTLWKNDGSLGIEVTSPSPYLPAMASDRGPNAST